MFAHLAIQLRMEVLPRKETTMAEAFASTATMPRISVKLPLFLVYQRASSRLEQLGGRGKLHT